MRIRAGKNYTRHCARTSPWPLWASDLQRRDFATMQRSRAPIAMPAVPDLLVAAARALRRERLADLFASDPTRVARMILEWCDWRIDFSKERLSPDALSLLLAHAESC